MIKLEHSDRRHQTLMMVGNGHVGLKWLGRDWQWRVMSGRATDPTARVLSELQDAGLVAAAEMTVPGSGYEAWADWQPVVLTPRGVDVLNAWVREHPIIEETWWDNATQDWFRR